MLITMLEPRKGSEDGFVVKQFHKGHKYEVRDMLAKRFLHQGAAYNSEPWEDAKVYHHTHEINGTEAQIAIRTPEGKVLAVIQTWDDIFDVENDARLIVDALNAYSGVKP